MSNNADWLSACYRFLLVLLFTSFSFPVFLPDTHYRPFDRSSLGSSCEGCGALMLTLSRLHCTVVVQCLSKSLSRASRFALPDRKTLSLGGNPRVIAPIHIVLITRVTFEWKFFLGVVSHARWSTTSYSLAPPSNAARVTPSVCLCGRIPGSVASIHHRA